MVLKLNRTGSIWDRINRNATNENWDIIEKIISDRGLEILSESGFLTWLDENGIKHREEVATFSDLPSSDSLNTVRGVEDENRIYIKKENGWVRFQTIDINKINDVEDRVYDVESRVYDNLNSRGVLATDPPIPHVAAKGDGVTDDTQAINNLLENFHEVYLPPLEYIVKDTIKVGRTGKALIGLSQNIRGFRDTATLIYDGAVNRKKTVVLIGQNDVGVEPVEDGTNNAFKNIRVDANYKAGFCVYGTYITNESRIDNIVAEKSLEYNYYLAKSWYATYTNLYSFRCKGKGIALGMPLEYQNGEKVTWTSDASLEMNNTKIDNLRSIFSGEYYSVDNTGTYTPHSATHRMQGYGIGAGIGNSFNLNNYTSEGSGGANLYVYNRGQPIKKISNGYLELAGRNSGLASASELPNIIIENLNNTGDAVVIDTVLMNANSGGIYHVGSKRPVKIKNAHQPQFLKSLDGIDNRELWSFILKENVYYQAGYSNTNEQGATRIIVEEVNTRYNFTIDLDPIPGGSTLIYLKSVGGADPYGVFRINYENGNMVERPFPNGMNDDGWTFSAIVNSGPISISKGGGTGDINAPVIFKVVKMPATN